MELYRVKEGFLACTYYSMYIVEVLVTYEDDNLTYVQVPYDGLRKAVDVFPDVQPDGRFKRVDKNYIVFDEQVHFQYDVNKREMFITCGDKKITVKYETKAQKWMDENRGPCVVYCVVVRGEGNPFADLSWVLQGTVTTLSYPAQMDVRIPANREEEFLAIADDRWVEVSRK